MNYYRITTTVVFTIRADDEDSAEEEVKNVLHDLDDCDPSDCYEIEEVFI